MNSPNFDSCVSDSSDSVSEDFLRDVIDGLSKEKKTLSCKYFYDERGSGLFDEICELDEYYVTRTEIGIMRDHAAAMADRIGPNATVIELGSGSSIKTTWLLERLIDPAAYYPVDISTEHLNRSAARLAEQFPDIRVQAISADFTEPISIPEENENSGKRVVYFPGSTIGNFEPDAARQLLEQLSDLAGESGGLLIGIDLQKDPSIIEAAYNDSKGTTGQFNLNILERMKRELNANVQTEQFVHRATYNSELGRVELDLVSSCSQAIEIAGHRFEFESGEAIRTEHSHKYAIDGFAQLAASVQFELDSAWTDSNNYFAILYFQARHQSNNGN